MKRLLLVSALMTMFAVTVFGQTYRTNDEKADRMALTIADASESLYSAALSEKAEEAIVAWYEGSYSKDMYELLDKDASFAFANILTFRETKKSDIIGTIKNTVAVIPNKVNWTDAMVLEGSVGCGYIEIYDSKKKAYFGVWLVIFEEAS